MTFIIPSKSAVGPVLQASKWIKLPVLIDAMEMEELLATLGTFSIVQVSGLIPCGKEIIPRNDFLKVYEHYIAALKNGENPSDPLIRPYFSSIFTTYPEALYSINVQDGKNLIKVLRPVVQLQAHRCDFSEADNTFRSMVIGMDSISWGIQFSYPHLYQDENLQVMTVRENEQFPNTALFKRMQHWVRHHTIATPFEVAGKRICVPVRLGKNCLSWINNHSHLRRKNIKVAL